MTNWLRVSLCLILAGSGLFPAAPAFAATIQTQGVVQQGLPGAGVGPIWTSPNAKLGSFQLGSLGSLSLQASIPVLTAPEVRVAASLAAPMVAPLATAVVAAPQAAPALTPAASAIAAQPVAPISAQAPTSLFQGLMETRTALSAAQDKGGAKTAQTLDSFFQGSAQLKAASDDAVLGAESAPASLPAGGPQARTESKLAPPAPAEEAAAPLSSLDRFVDFAKGLFFPDGGEAGIISHRGTRLAAMPADEDMIKGMELSPLTYPERLAAVIELFKHAGAKPEEVITQDAGRGQKNVYVVKKGRTDRVIVVGSHHDKADVGAGTIDNWSGTTMVINLYQAMRDMDTEATYVFASFAREEDGLIGSSKYLKSLTADQRKKIDAMVNLDTLAVDGTFSWQNNSTKTLLDMVKKVAAKEKYDLKEERLWGGDADSSSFREFGIAAMTLFGVSPERIFDIVHSENDTMAVFSMPHYKNAYLLTLALLKFLNLTPVGPERLAPAAA